MDEDVKDESQLAETETATDSSSEIEQPVADDVKEDATEEPVDERGVPLKNRLAEIERKKRKISRQEAEQELISSTSQPLNEDEAVSLLKNVVNEAVAPIKARQFLAENPDATNMIDKINDVRARHPELSGIDNLDLAYKVARAEMQDEIIRQKIEAERQVNVKKEEDSKQATVEGAGRVKAPSVPLTDRINSAKTVAELEALAKELSS